MLIRHVAGCLKPVPGRCFRRSFSASKSDGRSSLRTRFRQLTLGNQLAVVFGGVGLVGGGVGFLYNHWKERERERRGEEMRSLSYAEGAAVASMLQPFSRKEIEHKLREKAPPELWVERAEVQGELGSLRSSSAKDGKYVLVLGEKGTGKSFICYKLVDQQKGVVYLLVGKETKPEDFTKKLLEATGFNVALHPTTNPLPRVASLLHDVKEKLASGGVVPTVLVEIERNSDPEVIDVVCRTLKELSAVCRGFAIVTEATAAISLSPDPARRRHIWVGDFAPTEALEYLAKVNTQRGKSGDPELSQEEIKLVLERVGSRPADLHDMATSGLPVKEWVEERVVEEHGKMEALLAATPKYEPLLRALVEKGSLSTVEAMRMLHLPIDQIAEVAGAQHHVISVNPGNHTVQFHGQAMAVAAKAREAKAKWWFQRK